MEKAKTISFLDKMTKHQRVNFVKKVEGLLDEAYRTAANKLFDDRHWRAHVCEDGTLSLSPHNPDWAHAFGLVQGAALMVGYDMSEAVEGSPKSWFHKLDQQVSRKYYDQVKEATLRGDFEPTCSCGKKLIVTMKCPTCDRDE